MNEEHDKMDKNMNDDDVTAVTRTGSDVSQNADTNYSSSYASSTTSTNDDGLRRSSSFMSSSSELSDDDSSTEYSSSSSMTRSISIARSASSDFDMMRTSDDNVMRTSSSLPSYPPVTEDEKTAGKVDGIYSQYSDKGDNDKKVPDISPGTSPRRSLSLHSSESEPSIVRRRHSLQNTSKRDGTARSRCQDYKSF